MRNFLRLKLSLRIFAQENVLILTMFWNTSTPMCATARFRHTPSWSYKTQIWLPNMMWVWGVGVNTSTPMCATARFRHTPSWSYRTNTNMVTKHDVGVGCGCEHEHTHVRDGQVQTHTLMVLQNKHKYGYQT